MSDNQERSYKAFISYRHLPLEKSVAKRLHRRIEHFLIPKDQQKNGLKHPGLVFRDEDELPISSNLSADIEKALDHSEFLIVIFSPRTVESRWVHREITYFLSHHDLDHVLIVLTEGTSADLPPELTSYRSETGDEIFVEPLYADISAGPYKRKLFQTQTLKILAALIGCPYDALYRREQRYKTRRLAAAAITVFALCAAFISLLVSRNRQIRRSLDQALINQSNYLSSESVSLLADGDRMGAIALAIEALPSADNERPLVSNAEYALGLAVNAYTSPSQTGTITSNGTLSFSTNISDFLLNKEGTRLGAQTSAGEISCWDTSTLHQLWSAHPAESSWSLKIAGFTAESHLIVYDLSTLFCYDGTSGDVLWQKDIASLVSGEDYPALSTAVISAQNVIYALSERHIVSLTPDGAALQVLELQGAEDHDVFAQLSPDDSYLLLPRSRYDDDYRSHKELTVYDMKTGAPVASFETETDAYIPNSYVLTEEGTLYYLSSILTNSNFSVGSFQMMSENSVTLHAADIHTGEECWTIPFTYSFVGGREQLYFTDSAFDYPALAVVYANCLDLVNTDTGEVMLHTEHPSSILSLIPISAGLDVITSGGQLGTILASFPNQWGSEAMFGDGVVAASGIPDTYWIKKSSNRELTRFSYIHGDPTWTDIPIDFDGFDSFVFDDTLVCDEACAFLDGNVLYYSDGDPASPIKKLVLSGIQDNFSTKINILEAKDGLLTLSYFQSSEENPAGIINIPLTSSSENDQRPAFSNSTSSDNGGSDDGDPTYEIVPWTEPSLIPFFFSPIAGDAAGKNAGEGTLLVGCIRREEGLIKECVLFRTDRSFQVDRSDSMEFDPPVPSLQLYNLDGKGIAMAAADSREWYFFDLQDSLLALAPLPLQHLLADLAAQGSSPEEAIWLSGDRTHLAAIMPDGALQVIPFTDEKCQPVSMDISFQADDIHSACFTPENDLLMVITLDHSLYFFDSLTGKMQQRTELFSSSLSTFSKAEWDLTPESFISIRLDSTLNLVSLNDLSLFAYAPYCLGYQNSRDLLLCYSYDSTTGLGYFPRRSTADLIAYGRVLLNGWELDDTRRMQYGLQ